MHTSRGIGLEHDSLDGIECLAHHNEHGLFLRLDGVSASTDADHLPGMFCVDVFHSDVFDGEAEFWVAFTPVQSHVSEQVLERVILDLGGLLDFLRLHFRHTCTLALLVCFVEFFLLFACVTLSLKLGHLFWGLLGLLLYGV